jgi:dihydroorotate dehydrogenase electron transfer subunit
MLVALAQLTMARKIPCEVSVEERMACGFGVCMGCSVPMVSGGYKRACTEGPVFDVTEVRWE